MQDYETHNYQSYEVLYASQLNEMDEQIDALTDAVTELQTEVIPTQIPIKDENGVVYYITVSSVGGLQVRTASEQ